MDDAGKLGGCTNHLWLEDGAGAVAGCGGCTVLFKQLIKKCYFSKTLTLNQIPNP